MLKILIKIKIPLNFFPFSVDINFWNKKELEERLNRKYILFVGNDSNRDFNLLIKLARVLPEQNFIFVSNMDSLQNLKLKNVKIYKGNWNEQSLSDIELRNLYYSSKLSLIPLKDTTQPSGQSVALQSMATNTPVLISKTEGFWDIDKFSDEKNIFIINSNNVTEWKNLIERILDDNILLNSISENAKLIVKKEYNLSKFQNRLFKYVNLN